jgi:hypothetical protein
MRFWLLALFALCLPGLADTALDGLRASLTEMRGKPPDWGGPRGATPQLTIAKHQLRDWVESKLKTFGFRADEGELERRLNSELRDATLFCGQEMPNQQPCPDWSLLGFLDGLKLRRTGGFLILQTGVGIECGYDQSAYLYGWSSEGWRRVWQTEQSDYSEKVYKPQTIHAVLISPYSRTNDYLILTLGSQPWCSSNLHNVYYRVFRVGPDPEAKPLVDASEWAFVADDPPIHGSVTANDALVEFTRMGGLKGANYEAVRHFRFDHDQVKRVDPLALRPSEFVEEWLMNDWKQAAFSSESTNRRLMLEFHEKLHKDHDGHIPAELIYPTKHCPNKPDLWQVGVDFSDPPTPLARSLTALTFSFVGAHRTSSRWSE